MKKLTKVLLSCVLVSSSMFALTLVSNEKTVSAAAEDLNLVYQLDFEDASNLGKNSVSSSYADATVYQTEGHMSQVDRAGGKAIMIDGQTAFENYLNLPTGFFENQTEATISGWFYLDSTAAAYSGEIGIFSPENDKGFRTDSHANFHGGNYIYVIGNHQWFDSKIYPIYDGWYHMAYVLNGNHLDVYQNGHLVGSRDCDQFTSVSQLHSATSHFYLGQSAYETNHPDYKGGFDDVRVYQKALTGEQIRSEYGFDMFDFMTNEYTFDSQETLYKDAVRGYDLDPHGADEKGYGPTSWPTYDNGALNLDGDAMVVVARNEKHEHNGTPYTVNPAYLSGMSEVSFSIDVKVSDNTGFNWERILDVFKGGGQVFSMMTHQGSPSSSFDIVYQNSEHNNIRWILGENGKQFNLVAGRWYNMTMTSSDQEFAVYVDGELVAKINNVESLGKKAAYNFVGGEEPGLWFTLGSPIYENDRKVAASFDNFRVFSKALTADETKRIAQDYSRVTSKITLINEGQETVIKHPTKDAYQLEVLSKDKYAFIGWKDAAGNIYTEVPANTGDITLTAVFEELKFKVSFNANGGRGEMSEINITDEIKNLPESTFARTGYTFAGWSTTANGKVEYQDKADLTNVSQDLNLYAVWNAKQYDVTFNANGGEGTIEKITLTYDVEASLPASTLTRKGYTFAGWATTEDGVVVYADKAKVKSISEGNNVELYAVWLLNSYSVLFDGNGGEGSMASLTVNALELTKLPANVFTKEGYTFKGWAVNSEAKYADEEVVEIEQNCTLTAIWEINKYDVVFKDGTETLETVQVEHGSKVAAIEAPTKEGYTFKGWQLEGQTYDFEKEVKSELVLVAVWEKDAEEQPSEQPSEEPSEQPSEQPSEDPTPSTPKKGCRGSSMGLASLLAIAGILLVSKKRKNN